VSAAPDDPLVSTRHEPIERCLTCSDEAVAARVRSVEGIEALVAVGDWTDRVAIDLVPDARPGDLLLCHAGIALERLGAAGR
jgi:hydrogenase maturation factor